MTDFAEQSDPELIKISLNVKIINEDQAGF